MRENILHTACVTKEDPRCPLCYALFVNPASNKLSPHERAEMVDGLSRLCRACWAPVTAYQIGDSVFTVNGAKCGATDLRWKSPNGTLIDRPPGAIGLKASNRLVAAQVKELRKAGWKPKAIACELEVPYRVVLKMIGASE